MTTSPMQFWELADLRLFLRELRDLQVESLVVYYDSKSGGFYHRHDKPTPGTFSKSSTATCVLSLIATNEWLTGPWKDGTDKLVRGLLTNPWRSAGLPVDNVFTVAFVLDAVTELLRANPEVVLDQECQDRLNTARSIIVEGLSGPLSVQGYPPSAYVTQLGVRTVTKETALNESHARTIAEWAERELQRQIVLLTRNDRTADVFQLAYSAMLLVHLIEPDRLSPDQEVILDAALDELFQRQRDDGTWPLSRPLFHYPNVGSAHCYDYEMLVQLLTEPKLRERLLRFIPTLAKSARALSSRYSLGSGGAGWSSGHHPQFKGPESWSTASVYHFTHAFERLIAEQIRRETFTHLGGRYTPPQRSGGRGHYLPEGFLDCEVRLDGTAQSLREVFSRCVLEPLIEEERKGKIESGSALSKNTPVSVILFGPPGTSKTKLAEIMASCVGWPLLSIDASQFLKNGMDGVYAEADRIFGMLAVAERIVVLLDEFDEMVRARESATDVLSRFLTTAMLPKLLQINDNRRLVFVVATNHIEAFDVAIRRPGRFDVILQVMPPTAREKLRKWPALSGLRCAGIGEEELNSRLAPLTYVETEILVGRLSTAATETEKCVRLESANRNCTLLSPVSTGGSVLGASPRGAYGWSLTWQQFCDRQKDLSRVP